jgi:hypothetical protein
MIWLTWRQHRKQALFTLIGLAALAALLVGPGLQMHHAFTNSGLAECLRKVGHAEWVPAGPGNNGCESQINRFNTQFGTWRYVSVLFVFLPLLIGLFWGAPLVAREVEHGTHRLVWTQGVSRRRWAVVKFGLLGSGALVAAALYALGVSWWMGPLTEAGDGPFVDLNFDIQGLVPVAYTLFAVALGVFAGTVARKVLPAMAVTLVGFLGVRIALTAMARVRYLPPRTRTFPLETTLMPNRALGDWVTDQGIRDASGRLVAANAQMMCGEPSRSPSGTHACGSELGLGPGSYNWQLYQPGSRFWLFQSIEAGIFVALAAVLIYLAIRQVRRIA